MSKGSQIFQQLLMRGFPPETATRIVSGELPMENAQRVARGQERFDMNESLYHGGSSDFTEFDADITSSYGDFGKGIYMSDSHQEVSDFYAGPSEFRQAKIPMQEQVNAQRLQQLSRKELIEYAKSMTSPRAKEYLAREAEHFPLSDTGTIVKEIAEIEAKDKLKGNHAGAMYELVIDKSGVVDIKEPIISAEESVEYYELARQRLDQASDEMIESMFDGTPTEDDLEDLLDYYAADFARELNPAVNKITKDASEMGIELNIYPGETNWADIRHDIGAHLEDVEMPLRKRSNTLNEYYDFADGDEAYQKLPKNYDFDDGIDPLREGAITQELMKGVGIKGVRDTTAPDRFANMTVDESRGVHTIMFPGSENQIRSPQAAFDPNYRGGNMLGNAETGLLTGVAAAGVGASTLMNQSNEPSKPSNPSKPNDYGMMERLAAATAVQQQGSITNTPMSHRDQAKQAWVEQGLRDGTISSNHSGQKMANALNIAADFVPWLGGGAGAADTYDSVAAGNYGQAVVDGGTTLAGAVPVAARASRFTKGMLGQAARAYQARKNNRSAALMEEIVNQVAGDK